ncbi:hypothetical protein A3Q32_01640 [Alcanivorax sp. KX64203]|nr:hypothetical protein A3Q32_01640 [Alcanivorax sp. KX64203]
MHVQAHLRVALQKTGQQPGNILTPECRWQRQTQGAADLVGALPEPVGQGFQVFHQQPPPLRQKPALGGRVETAGGAVQQTYLQIPFQPLQTLAGHRHGKVEGTCRGADRALIQHA